MPPAETGGRSLVFQVGWEEGLLLVVRFPFMAVWTPDGTSLCISCWGTMMEVGCGFLALVMGSPEASGELLLATE